MTTLGHWKTCFMSLYVTRDTFFVAMKYVQCSSIYCIPNYYWLPGSIICTFRVVVFSDIFDKSFYYLYKWQCKFIVYKKKYLYNS